MKKLYPFLAFSVLLLSCSSFSQIPLTGSPTKTPTATAGASATFTRTYVPTWTDMSPVSAEDDISFSGTETPAPPEKTVQVHFINVGGGDATLIRTPNGKNILIDGGDANSGIVQYLLDLGIVQIDLMIATHAHKEAIGGLIDVLNILPVARVVMNTQISTIPEYNRFLNAIALRQLNPVLAKRGDMFSEDGINFLVLNPVDASGSDVDENSLVLQFSYGETSFLMMGDAGQMAESSLLATSLLSKVDFLKVGHHASADTCMDAFLDLIKPGVAVYFSSSNDLETTASQQTIARLISSGAAVYGTDVNGTIIITVEPTGFIGATFR